MVAGADSAVQFFAGYLTEYSLSVDNMFVFGVVMAGFAVPAARQALVLRELFILAGAAAIERFSATFHLFGVFLIFTAVQFVHHRGVQPDLARNRCFAWPRGSCPPLPATTAPHGPSGSQDGACSPPMAMVIVDIALPARPAGLPLLWAGAHPGLHRGQTHRPSRPRQFPPDLPDPCVALPDGDPHRSGHDHDRQPGRVPAHEKARHGRPGIPQPVARTARSIDKKDLHDRDPRDTARAHRFR
jgi:hypothetical protein